MIAGCAEVSWCNYNEDLHEVGTRARKEHCWIFFPWERETLEAGNESGTFETFESLDLSFTARSQYALSHNHRERVDALRKGPTE